MSRVEHQVQELATCLNDLAAELETAHAVMMPDSHPNMNVIDMRDGLRVMIERRRAEVRRGA